MIGSGLKKLAKENGMTVFGGVAYGSLRGFAATLSEGMGYKKIDFAVSFPDSTDREALRERIAASSLRSLYRITNISIGERVIQVTFHDTVGTMKRARSFLNFFIPLLEQYRAKSADFCAECGEVLTETRWVQVNGICYPMHECCARQVQLAVDGVSGEQPVSKGSYITGALGALAGALLGAVLWAVTLNLDSYVFRCFAAFLIGWLAEKGYAIARGRQGSGKTWIVAGSVALAVVLGAFGPDAAEIGLLILDGTLEGFRLVEVPVFILALLCDDFYFLVLTLLNMLMGGLCAAWGVFVAVMQTPRTGTGRSFRYMK